MRNSLEYRIMKNRPRPGWSWEVVDDRGVLARGVADTHKEAASQAAEQAERMQQHAAKPALSSLGGGPFYTPCPSQPQLRRGASFGGSPPLRTSRNQEAGCDGGNNAHAARSFLAAA
jgi:hypothetical protein